MPYVIKENIGGKRKVFQKRDNIFIIPESSHWDLRVFASQISKLEDLSVIAANKSPSLSHPKWQHIPGKRIWSMISACL